jgi:hypothetical protein
MMIKIISMMIFLATTSLALAKAQPCGPNLQLENQTHEIAKIANSLAECPRLELLDSLCTAIKEKTPEEDPESEHSFKFENIVNSAACVDNKFDTEIQAQNKIQELWTKHNDLMVCDSNNFSVSKGYMLKFAVKVSFTDFIQAAVRWKVPLNRLDQDGLTTLDYIQNEINRLKGTEAEILLKSYYKHLRDAGAKHKSEL